MKTAIIYASIHHGNTKKLVDAISSEFDVDLIDATKTTAASLKDYDLIGFASGIYAFKFHQAIINFASQNLPENKKIFFLTTSAMDKDFSKSMNEALQGKNAEIVGKFSCPGFNTFGPFKLVGGTNKGRPNEADVKNAVEFYRKLVEAE